MSRKTVKLTIRKNIRSPKYNVLFGYNKLATGGRVDFPWGSISTFGGSVVNPTRRSKRSGLRFIVENNRKRITHVSHNVSPMRKKKGVTYVQNKSLGYIFKNFKPVKNNQFNENDLVLLRLLLSEEALKSNEKLTTRKVA